MEPYPDYDVLAKWDSPSFNEVTREVVRRRLEDIPQRRFFSEAEYALLEAVCARLIPQPETDDPVPIAPWIDADLREGRSEGFSRPETPPLAEAWRRGLAALDEEARRREGRPFRALAPDAQDAILTAMQRGEAESFGDLPQRELFKLVLRSVVGVYYSHPSAWSEIGFGGPASPRGYVRLGLNERDPWEAPLAPPPGDRP